MHGHDAFATPPPQILGERLSIVDGSVNSRHDSSALATCETDVIVRHECSNTAAWSTQLTMS
jgi:hypothetical protein